MSFPVFWRESPLEKTAKRIIAGEEFTLAALSALDETLAGPSPEEWRRPSTLTDDAVIRLRKLEATIAEGDGAQVDQYLTDLHTALRAALGNAPAEPFLWSVLFWTDNTRNGFGIDHLKHLRMSYATGANEGWVAIKRNRLALALYPQLPPGLAGAAIEEFTGLVDSRFFHQAAAILTGPGWPLRDVLLTHLKDVELEKRQQFEKAVYRLGYDVLVPGVEPRGRRPWH